MGNCADVMLRPTEEKIRVLVFNEGEKEFSARTPVEKITCGPYSGFKLVHHSQPDSPLLPDARLQPGELYYLVPLQAQPHHPPIPSRTANQETGKQKKVKIVVTKGQLELLLRSTDKFKSKDIAIHCLGSFQVGEGRRKWRPSLTMIPEVHSF
ncbi:hypothetical protein CJ030_MR2G006274 [Morella rubra]|uniref:Uncharacterized protein n=1 Tax=Morella rubra TaxID=262757 RepID=A0A6A1W907_9ROSI|nr:hypothetical protein CJ030_MR2G006267 [Morella rubra]KAB1221701.1 hypothetical protein CJ030_MR2G006274 [Morella rubra]